MDKVKRFTAQDVINVFIKRRQAAEFACSFIRLLSPSPLVDRLIGQAGGSGFDAPINMGQTIRIAVPRVADRE